MDGGGSIIDKDRMEMALVCRKRDVVGAGFKKALPGEPPGPPYAPMSPCGWVGFEWKRELLDTVFHEKRGILSSKYGM